MTVRQRKQPLHILLIGRAVITLTVDNKTAEQYRELPQFTYTATGLIQGDPMITNPTISTQADMKSAGEFEIIASGADAGDNYTIAYVPGTLTVESHTEHTGGTATCTEKAKCSVCAVAYGDLAAHNYENGKCIVCETVDLNYVPETLSPQTGDNSHMAFWIALLFISGGAVITLTVYDRKRKTV